VILYRTVGNWAIRPLLHVVYRADVRGRERVPSQGPGILVANHESIVDPFVVALATPRVIRYLAKAELYESSIGRALMQGFGAIPIERGRGDHDAMAHAREVLRAGGLVGIFPQGTAKPYRRRPFHRGAARLALETGAPLVPIALAGTERVLRPHRIRLGLPKVYVVVGRPIEIEPRKVTIVAANALIAEVENAVSELRRPFGEPAHAWID
jgi:1-acyl-sn-glycerol-3-phosphate acyltransferase